MDLACIWQNYDIWPIFSAGDFRGVVYTVYSNYSIHSSYSGDTGGRCWSLWPWWAEQAL